MSHLLNTPVILSYRVLSPSVLYPIAYWNVTYFSFSVLMSIRFVIGLSSTGFIRRPRPILSSISGTIRRALGRHCRKETQLTLCKTTAVPAFSQGCWAWAISQSDGTSIQSVRITFLRSVKNCTVRDLSLIHI